ncbi:MAG: hypothetical protein AB8G16_05765 [Gammaproteobacteria bacterium]
MVLPMIRRWHDRQRAHMRRALNHPAPSTWENLGLWSDAEQPYCEAARALALRVAHQANLSARDSVLDIGPGQGPDQNKLWTREFSIGHYYGWERDTPPPPDRRWDHVLAVDSAYFVPGLWPRLQALWPQVNACGTMTWTDLYLAQPLAGLSASARLRVTSTLAGIPWTHWRTREQWTRCLAQLPQSAVQFNDLTDDVLGGFVRHMAWRRNAKRPQQGLWIAHGTAALLRPLLDAGIIGYGLFQARRKDEP